MNLDALSDLVLAAMCCWLFMPQRALRPGVAVAVLVIGISASIGTLRFAGMDALLGLHRFATLFTSCVAFTLLWVALAWPKEPLATRLAAAARFTVLFGALGVGLTQLGLAWWSKLVPGVCALCLLVTMLRPFNARGAVGAILLCASFAAVLLVKDGETLLGFLSRAQILHVLLTAALFALVSAPRRLGGAAKGEP